MSDDTKFVFKIDAYSPETIPLGRLGLYMHVLAKMLGEHKSVHFVELSKGSTNIIHAIEREAEPKVSSRIKLINSNNAPEDALSAFWELNDLLRKDNASGSYRKFDGTNIIEFPGIRSIVQDTFGPIKRPGTVDGVVQKVGGKDQTIPVYLEERDGTSIRCSTTREMAQALGKHLFGAEIRCSGIGEWVRSEDGVWNLKIFQISDFEVLELHSLMDTVANLRAIEGSGWVSLNEPWSELRSLHNEEDEA